MKKSLITKLAAFVAVPAFLLVLASPLSAKAAGNFVLTGQADGRSLVVTKNNSNFVVVSNNNFVSLDTVLNRSWNFTLVTDDNQLTPRRVVLLDRDNSNNRIVLTNFLTGPNSTNVNRVVLTVDSDFFARVSDMTRVNTNVGLRLNTGSNTVSMNTITGDLVTGNITVSVR